MSLPHPRRLHQSPTAGRNHWQVGGFAGEFGGDQQFQRFDNLIRIPVLRMAREDGQLLEKYRRP